MMNKMVNLLISEEGQGMAEYGLILGVLAIGTVVILSAMREQIIELYNNGIIKLKIASK